MRKITLLFFVFALLTCTSKADAQAYKTAIGIRFSSKDAVVGTGVTFKHFFRQSTAVEAILGLDFDPLSLGVLLEKHYPTRAAGLDWFAGGGAFTASGNRTNFGLLGIIGLDYKFNGIPLDVTLDWKPELFLVRNVDFEPAAVGASVRFAF